MTTARALLARAAGGMAVIAGISLVASLLVLASVIAGGRARQAHDVLWVGVATAVGVSAAALAFGAHHLLRGMRLAPALLLRSGG